MDTCSSNNVARYSLAWDLFACDTLTWDALTKDPLSWDSIDRDFLAFDKLDDRQPQRSIHQLVQHRLIALDLLVDRRIRRVQPGRPIHLRLHQAAMDRRLRKHLGVRSRQRCQVTLGFRLFGVGHQPHELALREGEKWRARDSALHEDLVVGHQLRHDFVLRRLLDG